MNEMLNRLGMNAKAAETEMRNLSTNKKNEVLRWMWKPEKGIICLRG